MTTSDVISTGTLLVMGMIALVLLIQYLKLRDIWQMILDCRTATRWARVRETENNELRLELRAEKAHVARLQKKLALLKNLIPCVERGC